MQALLSITLILCFLYILFAGCTRTQKPAQARLTVVATVLPIWTITEQVTRGIPGVDVKLLILPNQGSPHDISMTVAQGAMLEKADVLVMNGLGLERFLENNPALKSQSLQIIRVASVVDTSGLSIGTEFQTAHESDHEGFTVNPHGWVSPRQEIVMTRWLADQFALLDPTFAEQYRLNAERYVIRLDSLNFRFQGLIQQAPNKRIVTFHRAFDYLARDYGLEVVAVIENDPGLAPSARHLAELIQTIRESRPVAIFTEPYYPDNVAQTASAETGVPVFVLDPLETGPVDPEAYLQAMWSNLQTLGMALLVNRGR